MAKTNWDITSGYSYKLQQAYLLISGFKAHASIVQGPKSKVKVKVV